jgi:hypothetical protein
LNVDMVVFLNIAVKVSFNSTARLSPVASLRKTP